jgi:UDP-glucose 4-epimerase
MRALVTGGAGFIGSHLVDRLIAEGHEVDVWDDFSSGRAENVNPAVRWVNILDGDDTGLQAEYDWLFHLAARADLIGSIAEPSDYIRRNVMDTVHWLQEARRMGVQRFIYAASSSCYGAFPVTPTREREALRPAHPYALSKKMGEDLVLHWASVYRLPAVSLRLFNVYGPRARTRGGYGAVMGTFLAQRAQGVPLTVIGDGTQRRDFVWVEDVADAFVRAAQYFGDGIFNIGTGVGTSINRVAAMIGGPVVRIPARGGEPPTTQADTDKARAYLGWRATTPLEAGIARLLADLPAWEAAHAWTPEEIAVATTAWHQHLG